MVARVEVVTERREETIERWLSRLVLEQYGLPDSLGMVRQRFGRFAKPFLRRVRQVTDDPKVASFTEALISKIQGES